MIHIQEYLLSKSNPKAVSKTAKERYFEAMSKIDTNDNEKTVSKYIEKLVKSEEYKNIIYDFIADCIGNKFKFVSSDYLMKKCTNNSKIIYLICIYPDSLFISLINVPKIKAIGININADKIINQVSNSTTKEDLIQNEDNYDEHVYYYDDSPTKFLEEIYEFI